MALPRLVAFEVLLSAPPDTTPPETFIDAGPGAVTSDTTPTFTIRGTDNVSPPAALTFKWRIDGGAWTNVAAGTPTHDVTTAPLALGPHLFEVYAIDEALNADATPAAYSFTVIAPTAGRYRSAFLDILGLT